jgi:hypothetical protein
MKEGFWEKGSGQIPWKEYLEGCKAIRNISFDLVRRSCGGLIKHAKMPRGKMEHGTMQPHSTMRLR